MREGIHHIKTFELTVNWESLKKSWDVLLWKGKDPIESKKQFMHKYFYPALGKELNIKKTKGVKCVRVFYDENDEVLSITAYDKSGYIDFELNLEYGKKEEKRRDSKENDSSIEPEPDEKVYTHVFQEDLFDARGAIARTPSSAHEVVVQRNNHVLHFKRIPTCRWDIYMKDLFWLYHTVTGEEGRFYKLEYKLTEVIHKDVDGIIVGSRHMYYDRRGVLLKMVYMCGTPYGGAVVYDEEFWDYNFRENTATMKEISVRKDAILHLYKYRMDEQGTLRERKDYIYPRKEGSSSPVDQSADKLVHQRTLHYVYGKNGKLCEIKPVFCVPTMEFKRVVYEYDEQGRLISERDYDDNNEMVSEETYRFIDDRKVEVTCRIFMRSLTDRDGFKEQT